MMIPRNFRFLLPAIIFLTFQVFDTYSQPTVEPVAVAPTPVETATAAPAPIANNHILEKAAFQVLNERPWLNDIYSWNENFDLDHEQVRANASGAYCVGNGRAFALV